MHTYAHTHAYPCPNQSAYGQINTQGYVCVCTRTGLPLDSTIAKNEYVSISSSRHDIDCHKRSVASFSANLRVCFIITEKIPCASGCPSLCVRDVVRVPESISAGRTGSLLVCMFLEVHAQSGSLAYQLSW
jgi:hypothetical protein